MLDTILDLFRRIHLRERWERLSAFGKVAGGLITIGVLFAGVRYLPGVSIFTAYYREAGPEAQGVILSFVLVVCLASVLYAYDRVARAETIKKELKQVRTDAEKYRREAVAVQERWDRLLEVESREQLWQRPCKAVVPPFVSPGHRTTRFLTMLNLKGGVGKTTLTANLAAGLALDHGKRVLLVDIDFQGTLGDAAVDRQFTQLQIKNRHTVNRLLAVPAEDGLVPLLAVPMNAVPAARVILADDRLEAEDYSLQARFFVDPTAEVRFFFRHHFHQRAVFDQFDLVVFDCPPRLTTSTVNALACSDAVVIPTKLDPGSVNAVPRTIDWLLSLTGVVPARLAGVVACHAAVRGGSLTKADQNSYTYLRDVVGQRCPGQDVVFRAVVPGTPKAVSAAQGLVAGAADAGREVYRPVVDELKTRLSL
jgi:cellulose biosynthesis protein BcsQ